MSAVYKLPLVLEPQPEGGYTVTCPILPELITEGDTVQECIANAGDALQTVIELYEDVGCSLPAELKLAPIGAPIELEMVVVMP